MPRPERLRRLAPADLQWSLYGVPEQLENPERATAEWIDTWTGARQTAGPVRAGVLQRMTKPQSFGKAPAVLVVKGAR